MVERTSSKESAFSFQQQKEGRSTEPSPEYTCGSGLRNHSTFFFNLITFKVGGMLFRVPRHVLETESTTFANAYLGKDERKREFIYLSGVNSDEFSSLLKVLYPEPKSSETKLGSFEWVSVLKLSCAWEFGKIRTLAMENLKGLGPIEKLKLAKDLEITESNWIYPALYELVTRREPLSDREATMIGLSMTMKVFRVRDRHYMDPTMFWIRPPMCIIEKKIKDEFK